MLRFLKLKIARPMPLSAVKCDPPYAAIYALLADQLKALLDTLLDSLLPIDENCALCGISMLLDPPYLCPKCLQRLEPIAFGCDKCGRPRAGVGVDCAYCNPSAEPYVKRLLGYTLGGAARQLLHRYKYSGERYLAVPLAELYVQWHNLNQNSVVFHGITSIPSGRKRRRRRGFDHCGELAQALANRLDLPYVQLLTRVTHERAQAELNRIERADNLKDAFLMKPEAAPWLEAQWAFHGNQLNILVFDDVLTTGATLDVATALLSERFPRVQWYQGAVFYTVPELKNDAESSNWMFNVEDICR